MPVQCTGQQATTFRRFLHLYPALQVVYQLPFQLFSLNRGDAYLPSTLPNANGTLFWSVVRKYSTNEVIIKVGLFLNTEAWLTLSQISNTAETVTSVEFDLPLSFTTVASTGTAQVLSGAAGTSNTPLLPYAAVPVTNGIMTGRSFTYETPGYSVSVLTFVAH